MVKSPDEISYLSYFPIHFRGLGDRCPVCFRGLFIRRGGEGKRVHKIRSR